MSSGAQHAGSAPTPRPAWDCASVVTTGRIPAASHMSMNSKGPQPASRLEPHVAEMEGRSHAGPVQRFQK